MAVGLASGIADEMLDALLRNNAWTFPTAVYIKLHLGDPGAAGAGNPAAETTRVQATFSASSGGAITNSADIDWTNLAATETISHISAWDAAAAGTFLFSDALNASVAVAAGGDFSILAGELDINLAPIAA